MTLADVAVSSVHLLFAAVWTGSVVFMTIAVLPAAREGALDSEPLSRFTTQFKRIARASAVVTLLTGGHQAANGYMDSLFSTTRGHLVVGMVVLWLTLAALSEIGAARLADGTDERKVRTPAADARPFFLAASVVAVALFVDAGALVAPW
ncbi:putative membrane protein [Halorhabdus sp. SVX81]|uniref:CopD family protein n=1 Tax=Halorhabdus sp. SVX81 TaxID=2978283 RepID=UPI0023DB84DA|nr:CopD family protein [Halorhabdus sp. SVX81]WEL16869.1 putative membrane protein [Halorhabdus sp. SVX81]